MKRSGILLVIVLAFAGMLRSFDALAGGQLIQGQDRNTRPACSELSGQRGRLWINESAAGTADYAQVCAVDASGTYAWTALPLAGGGGTENKLAKFDSSGALVDASSSENAAGGVTLSSSLTLTGDANISDDLFVSDAAQVIGGITFNRANIYSGSTWLVYDAAVAGNAMGGFQDTGTTANLQISGNQIRTWSDGASFQIADNAGNALVTALDGGTSGGARTGFVDIDASSPGTCAAGLVGYTFIVANASGFALCVCSEDGIGGHVWGKVNSSYAGVSCP